MSMEYVLVDKLKHDDIHRGVWNAGDRLASVLENMPGDDYCEGEEPWGACVVEEVAKFLKALAVELDGGSIRHSTDVKIFSSLYFPLLEHCEKHLGELSEYGIDDPEVLVENVVNEALADAMKRPIDVRRAFKRRLELMDREKARAAVRKDMDKAHADAIVAKCVPAVWLNSPAGQSEKTREALRKTILRQIGRALRIDPNTNLEELREQIGKSLTEAFKKCGPTAGESGRTAKARRPQDGRKGTAKARRGQSRAA